jgi:HAE1 family hydrophobic/amphiphilic exporter-1
MTFGGLALGVGMIVDASIVVLENTYRHMEHGKIAHAGRDRRQRGSLVRDRGVHAHARRRLRAAALPAGVSSIMFVQLSVVVMFSLSMSLFVAVTVVPVLCSRMLKMPVPVEQRRGVLGPALHRPASAR